MNIYMLRKDCGYDGTAYGPNFLDKILAEQHAADLNTEEENLFSSGEKWGVVEEEVLSELPYKVKYYTGQRIYNTNGELALNFPATSAGIREYLVWSYGYVPKGCWFSLQKYNKNIDEWVAYVWAHAASYDKCVELLDSKKKAAVNSLKAAVRNHNKKFKK